VIIAHADASVDHPIVSVGYVLYKSTHGEQRFLDAGTRIINADQCEKDVEWTSHKAEYWAGIIATRASLDYENHALLLHLDENGIVERMNNDEWDWEDYFPHTFRSFANRFRAWRVSPVKRSDNEAAHEQARIGLKIGRDIHGESA